MADGCAVDLESAGLAPIRVRVYADSRKTIPMHGVSVALMGVHSNLVTRTTDSGGMASFRLSEGKYVLYAVRLFAAEGESVDVFVSGTGERTIDYVFSEAGEEAMSSWFSRRTLVRSGARKMAETVKSVLGTIGNAIGNGVSNLVIPAPLQARFSGYSITINSLSERASRMVKDPPGLECKHNLDIWKAYQVARLKFGGAVSDASYDLELTRNAYSRLALMCYYKAPGYIPGVGWIYALITTVGDMARDMINKREETKAANQLDLGQASWGLVSTFDERANLPEDIASQIDVNTARINANNEKIASRSEKSKVLREAIAENEVLVAKGQANKSIVRTLARQKARLESFVKEIGGLAAENKALESSTQELLKKWSDGWEWIKRKSLLNKTGWQKAGKAAKLGKLAGGALTGVSAYADWKFDIEEHWNDYIRYNDCLLDDMAKLRAAFDALSSAYAKQYHSHHGNGAGGADEVCLVEKMQPDATNRMDSATSTTRISCDPNEMDGPAGAGARRVVAPGTWATYTVYFENQATAETAAQEVRVALSLDPALDWSTFEFGEVVFGGQIDNGLSGRKRAASEVKLEGTDYHASSEASFDEETGTAAWYLRIVDRTTADQWPKDLYAGILPPNDETGRGEGHLTYRVKVRDDAVPGSIIRASASIVFDYNEAIETNPAWWNTVGETGEVTLSLTDGDEMTLGIVVGEPYGNLPVPERLGWTFGGWFTGLDGTGTEVSAETVANADTLELFAKWVRAVFAELWLDVTHGSVAVGTNGVTAGYAPDGSAVEGLAERYVLTGTSSVHSVRFAGGSFTNTWTNLMIGLSEKDAVGVALEGARVEVTLEGDNFVESGEDCAGVRVDAASALVLQGEGRLVAQGGKCGAGIGGGKLQESGRVEIHSGTIEAIGGEYGAGIGGGLVAPAAAAVVITGGSIKARGSDGGEDIGGGFGREGTGVPVDAAGTPVHEVEVPFATDTLPAEVVVDLGGGKTYRYAGPGHEGDTSLWFWLPDGTYEFAADGDDYGAHVAGEGTSAVFTDPGNANFVAPPVGGVWNEDGTVRAGLNPAYRTSPFELWTATGLAGKGWNWTRLPPSAYAWDPTNAVIRIPDDTNRMRMLRLRFLER